MSRHSIPQLAKSDLDRLRRFRLLPNLTKIPLFSGLMVALGLVAWNTESQLVLWSAYIALGYLWMSMVTFMHDATHSTLFKRPLLNWMFGILCMLPIFATFVAFREDHIEHHPAQPLAARPGCIHHGAAWRGPISCCSMPTR